MPLDQNRSVTKVRSSCPTAPDALSRRRFLAGVAGLGGAAALGDLIQRASAAVPADGGIGAIEHVVIFIQENRSFDHYFGTMSGVRGFSDPSALPGVFAQAWPSAPTGHVPAGTLLPFRLNRTDPAGACVHDITHAWGAQHRAWNGGRMDAWAATHSQEDGAGAGPLTMGYLAGDDLPFYRALANAFTICDNYHCSLLGPTDPNRLYSLSATIDPDGRAGGPIVDNSVPLGSLRWTTMPEQLEAAGVSWKVYQFAATGPTNGSNSVLPYFAKFGDPRSSLYRKGLLPTFPGEFEIDCVAGTLPQVSWVLAPPNTDEHPSNPPADGEFVCAEILRALVANPTAWARTALFVTYDENGGFFDHVPPPVAPPGTAGEYLTTPGLPAPAEGIRGPIGLGFRVPCLVVSPFSRGGWVCSETFDHTSLLRFVERRFGVEVPNLSAWRRATCGDLTAAFDFRSRDSSTPRLPDTIVPGVGGLVECIGNLEGKPAAIHPVPAVQQPVRQDPGTRPHRP